VAETLIESVGDALPVAMKNRIIGQFQRMSSEALQAFCEHGLSVITVRDLREVVDLGKVRCETIILHGANDAIIDLEDVRSWLRRFRARRCGRSKMWAIFCI
jgi:hypothetical protein